MLTAEILETATLTERQVKRLNTQRIFFGHQSVGDNILSGIAEVIASDPRLEIRILTSDAPESTLSPGLFETHLGRNRDPESKNAAFASIIEKGLGNQGGIALLKYCYIDFNARTDVRKASRRYRELMTDLRVKYPSLILVHVTVPLTVGDPGATSRERIRAVARKLLGRDENVKRNGFNKLLRKTYLGKEPVFDLAEIESTRADGSRSFFRRGVKKIYTLAPELTVDGGHLNQQGRRIVAERLLVLLANL